MARQKAKDTDAKKRVTNALVSLYSVVRNTSQFVSLIRQFSGTADISDLTNKIVPHALNELENALSAWLAMKGYNRQGQRIKMGKVVQQDPDESEDPEIDDDGDEIEEEEEE